MFPIFKERMGANAQGVLGPIKLTDRSWVEASSVGQWQDGEFQPIAPPETIGVKPMIFPKPEWQKR